MKVSLITTVYNEEKSITKFLDSYSKQTLLADEFIIVDGGSNDSTKKIINEYSKNNNLEITLIIDETCSLKYSKGPIAKGRNVAIKNAQYDIIAVTDCGCKLENSWLENIVKPFQNEQIDVVSGWYEALVENDFQKVYTNLILPKLDKLVINDFLPSSRSIAFRKKCWVNVGGYPEETYTSEDTIFDIRLKEKGFKFYFSNNATVYWSPPYNLREAFKKKYNYGYSDGQYRLFLSQYIKRFFFLVFPFIHLLRFKNNILKTFACKYVIDLGSFVGYLRGVLHGQ